MNCRELCSYLPSLFPKANYLALNAGISKWSKVNKAQDITDLPLDEVVRTKCRLTADSLSYLLSFEPFHNKNQRAWWFRLRGMDKENQPTSVGHALVIIEDCHGNHLLVDSYIGCRDITCRQISLEEFINDLLEMEKRFHPDLWEKVTGCREEESVDHVMVALARYSYTTEEINKRIAEMEMGYNNPFYGHQNHKDTFKKINLANL